MSDDISREIRRAVNNIEDDKSRRRQLKSDINDLYHGYTSLEEQVESLSEENRHYRTQFERAIKGIDRQLEKNEHRLDAHERRLDSFRNDLDYLRKNGVEGSSRRSFMTEGIVAVLGAGVLGTFGKAAYESHRDDQRVKQMESDTAEKPIENPDFTYTDTELEEIISNDEQLESYDSELHELIDLDAETIYGEFEPTDNGSLYTVASEESEMEIKKDLWIELDEYSE